MFLIKILTLFILLLITVHSLNVTSNSIRILQRTRRIVGGIVVSADKFPFVVSLRGIKNDTNGKPTYYHFCGGTLIHKYWVVTAAHCVHKITAKDVTVFIENPMLMLDSKKQHNVEKITMGNFNIHTYYADIAILKLEFGINDKNIHSNEIFNESLQSVKLASSVAQPSDCLLFGYGSTKYADEVSQELRYAKLKVITHNECEEKIGRIMTPQRHWGMFCAEGKNVDACQGDSGGPILCKTNKNSNDYEFSGIVSYGIGCGVPNIPGVYTSIFFHRNWILHVINNE